MVLKPYTHARVSNLPLCPELTRAAIPRTADLFRFLAVTGASLLGGTFKAWAHHGYRHSHERACVYACGRASLGTVVRTGSVKMLESERLFQCGKCKHQFALRADVEQYFAIPKPGHCPSDTEPRCPSTQFAPILVDIGTHAHMCDHPCPSPISIHHAHCPCSSLRYGGCDTQRNSRRTAATFKRYASRNKSASWPWAIYPPLAPMLPPCAHLWLGTVRGSP
jgi:hypothetical protein